MRRRTLTVTIEIEPDDSGGTVATASLVSVGPDLREIGYRGHVLRWTAPEAISESLEALARDIREKDQEPRERRKNADG